MEDDDERYPEISDYERRMMETRKENKRILDAIMNEACAFPFKNSKG